MSADERRGRRFAAWFCGGRRRGHRRGDAARRRPGGRQWQFELEERVLLSGTRPSFTTIVGPLVAPLVGQVTTLTATVSAFAGVRGLRYV